MIRRLLAAACRLHESVMTVRLAEFIRDLRETEAAAVRLARAYVHARDVAQQERALRYAERRSAAAEASGDRYAAIGAAMDEADAMNALRRLGVEP